MLKLFEFLRRIYLVVLFILLEAGAIGYYAHSSDYTRAKLLTRSNQVVGGVRTMFGSVGRYFTLGRENRMLLERVAALEGELAAYRRHDADSLWRVVAEEPQKGPYTLSTARVVANSVNKSRNFLMLDRGAEDGVHSQSAVLASDGSMVGYVAGVSDHYAAVVSILNTSFRSSGKIAGDNYYGSIRWEGGDRHRVTMSELSKYADIRIGAEVVSTGFSDYFPAEVLIGWVENFELDDTQMAYDVVIRLAADLSGVQDVILLHNNDLDEIRMLEQQTEQAVGY